MNINLRNNANNIAYMGIPDNFVDNSLYVLSFLTSFPFSTGDFGLATLLNSEDLASSVCSITSKHVINSAQSTSQPFG